ncbi:GNAT family N-acetyltransferase [Pigmentiphaga sp.]|uniref:GNAT family N-acetyltransferase n=1 Tax=Pigmentiphaga sp. TaxID=1977564 RepID=UPI00128C84B4|nr:GNAT family N-acetyltransferase [Pigmentiphaga sp.]MPS28877.1 GNAT family N-acetyltransferase [Alcaligenaceae bacterium SAGV5]MPS52631.1 GNAT family N-acetyltransferase [Alcaligenaceae bacterium SAGV3]MPT60466.1 GNAT family N-acetyltransferase [Alcaligenaceae bacterium]
MSQEGASTHAGVRPARPEDVAAILALMRGLAEYENLTHLFLARDEDLRDALFGPAPAAECLVAEAAGAVAGYALFFHNYSTFLGRRGLYLEDLYVHPGQRGRGLGKSLLRALAALAVERRCGRFEWSVLDWNQPAIDFYQAMGADVLPDWRIVRVTGDALARLGSAAEQAGARGR